MYKWMVLRGRGGGLLRVMCLRAGRGWVESWGGGCMNITRSCGYKAQKRQLRVKRSTQGWSGQVVLPPVHDVFVLNEPLIEPRVFIMKW